MSITVQDVRVEEFCPAESQALQHVAVTELRKHNIGVSHSILKGEDLSHHFYTIHVTINCL